MTIEEQLAKIAVDKIKFENGRTVKQVLKDEADRLRDCIQKYIDEYYNSYAPTIYARTMGFRKSLYVDDIADIETKGNTISISLRFNTALATHPNLDNVFIHEGDGIFGSYIKDKHESFVPVFMEYGWHAKKLESMIGYPVYRLTYFEGIHAIEQGIRDFNQTNPYNLKIDDSGFRNARAY